MEGLAADASQLGVSGSGSFLALNPYGFGEAGQRWLAQLKPDPLCGRRGAEAMGRKRGVALAALVATVMMGAAASPPGVDLAVAGVPLLDSVGAEPKLKEFQAVSGTVPGSRFVFTSADRREVVTLEVHPGASRFEISEVELSVGVPPEEAREFPGATEGFVTKRGVRLGMTQAAVRAILGPPTHESPGKLDYVYAFAKWQWLIDQYNMPSYQGTYRFTDDSLVRARFGFPYP